MEDAEGTGHREVHHSRISADESDLLRAGTLRARAECERFRVHSHNKDQRQGRMTLRSTRVVLIASLLAISAACGDKIIPTAPTSGPCTAAPPQPQYVVTGTVVDTTGRPVEGVQIKGGVFVSKCGGGGFTVLTDI